MASFQGNPCPPTGDVPPVSPPFEVPMLETSNNMVATPTRVTKEWLPFCEEELKPKEVSDFHKDDLSKDVSWLEDSDDEEDEASMLDREWKTRHEQFYNAGYREGISAGRNDAAQEGFNHGFKDSMMIGYKWGIVRGVTSALAHLPNELKVKLVERDEVRKEFLSLHGVVESISTEDALKFFYEDIQRAKPAEQRSTVESGSSATRQSISEHGALENYIGKLELLLEHCPAFDLHSELNQDRVP